MNRFIGASGRRAVKLNPAPRRPITGCLGAAGNKPGERGFTLIEIMVSVGLLAVVSVLVFSAIGAAFNSYEVLTKRSKSQSEFASIVSIINDDLVNLVPRPIRTSANQREGAFVFDAIESEYLMEFTRSGSSIINQDPDTIRQMGIDNPQTGLSRVAYKFADETLYRYEWGILDRDKQAENPLDRETILLEEVSDVQVIAYSATRDKSLQEETRWPATTLSGRSKAKEFLILPGGVSIRVFMKDGGELFLFFPGSAGVAI